MRAGGLGDVDGLADGPQMSRAAILQSEQDGDGEGGGGHDGGEVSKGNAAGGKFPKTTGGELCPHEKTRQRGAHVKGVPARR